jgi:hypothetical protein
VSDVHLVGGGVNGFALPRHLKNENCRSERVDVRTKAINPDDIVLRVVGTLLSPRFRVSARASGDCLHHASAILMRVHVSGHDQCHESDLHVHVCVLCDRARGHRMSRRNEHVHDHARGQSHD